MGKQLETPFHGGWALAQRSPRFSAEGPTSRIDKRHLQVGTATRSRTAVPKAWPQNNGSFSHVSEVLCPLRAPILCLSEDFPLRLRVACLWRVPASVCSGHMLETMKKPDTRRSFQSTAPGSSDTQDGRNQRPGDSLTPGPASLPRRTSKMA